jgi:hypothetical protein
MPILPLDHPEPLAATLGVMLYPGEDEADQKYARAYAAQFLAEPLRLFQEAGGTLAYKDLLRIATDGAGHLDDLDDRLWRGTATGEMFKAFFALAHTDPSLASWGNATKLAQVIAAQHRGPGSRASLYAVRRRFGSVAHLWAALCIRERRFQSDPDVGYEGWHDFQFFLTEAEILRWWGRSWRADRAKSEPPLPAETWRVPEGWAPPEPQPGWPRTGVIPHLTIPDDLLVHLSRPGRPRKSD